MPVPTPRKGEEKQAFISRCMGDSVMVKEYEQEQRAAICYSQWKRSKKSSKTTNKQEE